MPHRLRGADATYTGATTIVVESNAALNNKTSDLLLPERIARLQLRFNWPMLHAQLQTQLHSTCSVLHRLRGWHPHRRNFT